MMWRPPLVALAVLAWNVLGQLASLPAQSEAPAKILANTQALETKGDITSELVDGVDRFLLKQLAAAPAERQKHWPELVHTDLATEHPLVGQLKTIIGLRDQRVPNPQLEVVRDRLQTAAYQSHPQWQADRVRWPVLSGVDAEGLYVRSPGQQPATFQAIIIPDAGQTPEQLIGVGPDSERVTAWATNLAAIGGEVIVTTPISRHREARRGRAKMTDQEFIYRSAFELGRHALGYQVHETLAAIESIRDPKLPLIVVGWGEGGWIALHTAAVSNSVSAVCISGHFQARENVWQEPIHRNVQSLLTRFGDAELAAMIAPRKVIIDNIAGPQVEIGGEGGAPGKLTGPAPEATAAEVARAHQILEPKQLQASIVEVKPSTAPTGAGPSLDALKSTLAAVKVDASKLQAKPLGGAIQAGSELVSVESRRLGMLEKWDRFSQRVLENADDERLKYWQSLKTDSLDNFKQTVEPYREKFAKDVIGRWEMPLAAPQPRTRLAYEKPKWVGYEVVLDVFPDVIAYGVLLLPRDQAAGEKRPCVVFQHGLEGRPQDCIEGDHPAYHDVAAKLAEQGFVVFAPQNLYIFHDRFRTLQRKSNPLGKTLFSTIIPQHQQICRWLGQLPQVDASRIAFYGLSYGGKSAMRIPPLVPEYCLSICSADFNDWVWKNASTHSNYSYVWTMEYEIFEFDLGSRFNYAEMSTLIAPRPFMVERGHFDGVAPDERVALEFAKVRHLYAAKLGLKDSAQIEWFVGPHTINGQGTYEFLHKHLHFR